MKTTFLFNLKTKLIIIIAALSTVLLTACLNSNNPAVDHSRNPLVGSEESSSGNATAYEGRYDASQQADNEKLPYNRIDGIKNTYQFTRAGLLIDKYGIPGFGGWESDLQKNCYEIETVWGKILQLYGEKNISVNMDSFVRQFYAFHKSNLEELTSDTPVILECIKGAYDLMFLGNSDASNMFGYIRTGQTDDMLFWTDLPSARTYVTQNDPDVKGKDISGSLFELLAGEFYFSPGAGAASTSLTIASDGSFTGVYSNYDIGGEQTKGTTWISEFTGQFGKVTKVDEYIYSMEVATLVYDDPGKETEKDGMRYITTAPRGLTDSKEILVYLPNCKRSDMHEQVVSALSRIMDKSTWCENEKLIVPAFYNVTNEKENDSYEVFVLYK